MIISRTDWKQLLAYVTGSVDEEFLRRNEYLVTENQILRAKIKGRLPFTDDERCRLAEVGARLGRKSLRRSPRVHRWRHTESV